MCRSYLTICLIAGGLSFTTPVIDADFPNPVVSVLDGGTIEVAHNYHPERIRLNGINCPDG